MITCKERYGEGENKPKKERLYYICNTQREYLTIRKQKQRNKKETIFFWQRTSRSIMNLKAIGYVLVKQNLFQYDYIFRSKKVIIRSTLLIYLLTPWCRVLLEKLTGLKLVKKFPAFHGTRSFITALKNLRFCLYPGPAQSSPYTHITPPGNPS